MERMGGDRLPRREIYREGETPILEISVELPLDEGLPAGVIAYYRSLKEGYGRACGEWLLPAARAAFLALPEPARRFGFRRYRFSVRCRTETHGGYLLVLREVTLSAPSGTRRREVSEVFELPGGRLVPPLVFLRAAVGRLPRGARRFRRASMTFSGEVAILTAPRGGILRVTLPAREEKGADER